MIAKLKKIDSITMLLLFFLLFLLALFLYLIKVDKDVSSHALYHDNLIQAKILNKSFDNFLLTKSTFENYDHINKKVKSFEEILSFLDSRDSKERYGKEYFALLENLKNSFKLKLEFIESFKSNHASLLNSIHYIFDLNRAIEADDSLDDETKEMVSKQTLKLMRFYVNSYIDKKDLQEGLELLHKVSLQNTHNLELTLFVSNVRKNMQRVERFNNLEKKVYENNSLIQSIERVHRFLEQQNNEMIFIEKMIAIVFFIVAMIILVILIIMHIRAVHIREELLAFKSAVENSDNSIVMTDHNKNITYVNDVFERETGYTKEEVLGENPRVLKSGKMPQSLYDELNAALDRGEKWEGELINVRKDESYFYEKASIIPIYVGNKLKNYLAIKLNITDYIEQKQEIEYLALHDSLTQLPNRTSIEKSIERTIDLAKRNDSSVIILFINIDRFKTINDTLGHYAGDELLVKVAERLNDSLRQHDTLARLGGDEFLVVLESFDNELDAGKTCNKILQLFNTPFDIKGEQIGITLSIGIAIYPDDGQNYKTLLKNADIAMYQAKNAGKNTFRYYQEELSREVESRLNIEKAFTTALKAEEFTLVYQPQYTLAEKKVVGLEALVRWQSESLGFVTPDKFIPIAEDTGFILELGKFIFKQACIDFLEFKKHSQTLETISINVSAVQLHQASFLDEVLSIIKDLNIASKSIIIEITETYIMKDVKHSMQILQDLKRIGFGISIDDFGTGHSSLSYLKQFPLNELKIDKAFIDGIPHDTNDVAITKVIIGLSQNLEYMNVAEGVEYEEQEEFLLEHGCALGQGYHFCKPQKKDDLIEFFKKGV